MKNSIMRWLRPKTEADRWRTIDINLKICAFNISAAIVVLFAAIIFRLTHHK